MLENKLEIVDFGSYASNEHTLQMKSKVQFGWAQFTLRGDLGTRMGVDLPFLIVANAPSP